MKRNILAPSILSANFSNLQESIRYIEQKSCEWVHIDIMDGSFVPNITIGDAVVASLRPLTKLIFDVHLMTVHPENHINTFAHAGADYITFHYESSIHHHRIIQQIHQEGKKAGISIVPSTPVSVLYEILPYVDIVLVMTVNPGFGGQKLIDSCVKKIELLKKIRQEHNYSYLISVDGGVNSNTLETVVNAGTDVFVSGSAFFSGELFQT